MCTMARHALLKISRLLLRTLHRHPNTFQNNLRTIHSTLCRSSRHSCSTYFELPKYLRYMRSVKTNKIKFEHDKFLELIPDEPKIHINYATALRSNSILDHLSHGRAQVIYNSVQPMRTAAKPVQISQQLMRKPLQEFQVRIPIK